MSLHTLYFMMNRDVVGKAFNMDTVDLQAESWRCKQQYDSAVPGNGLYQYRTSEL